MHHAFCLLLLAAVVIAAAAGAVPATQHRSTRGVRDALQPEQLHLAFGEDPQTTVRALWVVQSTTAVDSHCRYGTVSGTYSFVALATNHTYPDGGFNGTIYFAEMSNLTADTRYFYRCGSSTSESSEYNFWTAPRKGDRSAVARIATFGDMGAAVPGATGGKDSSRTQARLTTAILNEQFRFIINVGDSSYANDYPQPNAPIYDQYFNQVQPFAARAPFMMCPGNHEREFDFAPYLNRTFMPHVAEGLLSRFYYSFDYGPMHIVSFSTEHNTSKNSEQWNFVVADLQRADANRAEVPWIVVFTHHPFYCSDLLFATSRCGTQAKTFQAEFEEVFKQYKIDLFMAGHNHMYERSFPMYKDKSVQKTYINATAPVYIVNGAAGDKEGNEELWIPDVEWVAFHGSGLDTGYALMNVSYSTIEFEYYDSETGKLVDRFVMNK